MSSSALNVASPLLGSFEPVTVVVVGSTLTAIDPRLDNVVAKVPLGQSRVQFSCLSSGELVAVVNDCVPVAIHVTATCTFGLSAFEAGLSQMAEERKDEVVLLKKLWIESNPQLKLFLNSSQDVSLLFEDDESCLYRCSIQMLLAVCGDSSLPSLMEFLHRSKELDPLEKHVECVRYERLKRFLAKSMDEMNDEALSYLLFNEEAEAKVTEMARLGFFAFGGKIRHANSTANLPHEGLDFKHLLADPAMELLRLGCNLPSPMNVPWSDSLASQVYHSLTTVPDSNGDVSTDGVDSVKLIASSRDVPVLAMAWNSGLVTVHTKLERASVTDTSLSRVFSFPVCNGNQILALAVSPAASRRLTELEADLNRGFSKRVGKGVFPGISVHIPQGKLETFTGSLVSVSEDASTCEVIIEAGGVKTTEVLSIDAIEPARAEDGDLVFLLPFHNDEDRLGKIGRVVGPFLNSDSSTCVVRLGTAASEPYNVGKYSSARVHIPPVSHWSLSRHCSECTRAGQPIPYPTSYIVVLNSQSTIRAELEFSLEKLEGQATECAFAVITEEGLTLFRRSWSPAIGMRETQPVRFWTGRQLNRVEFVTSNVMLVADQQGRVFLLDASSSSPTAADSSIFESSDPFVQFPEGSQVNFALSDPYVAMYTATSIVLFRIEVSKETEKDTLQKLDLSFDVPGGESKDIVAVAFERSNTQLRICFADESFQVVRMSKEQYTQEGIDVLKMSLKDELDHAVRAIAWIPVEFQAGSERASCWRNSLKEDDPLNNNVLTRFDLDFAGTWVFRPVITRRQRDGDPSSSLFSSVFTRFEITIFNPQQYLVVDVVEASTMRSIPSTNRIEDSDGSFRLVYEVVHGTESVQLVVMDTENRILPSKLGWIRFWGREVPADEADPSGEICRRMLDQSFILKVFDAASEMDPKAFEVRRLADKFLNRLLVARTFPTTSLKGLLKENPEMLERLFKAQYLVDDGAANLEVKFLLGALQTRFDRDNEMQRLLCKKAIQMILSPESSSMLLKCSTRQGLSSLLEVIQLSWSALGEESVKLQRRLLERLLELARTIATEDGDKDASALLRQCFGLVQNPLMEPLGEAVEVVESDYFELNPPTSGQSASIAAQSAAAFVSATHTAANLTAAAAGTSSTAATNAILALAASLTNSKTAAAAKGGDSDTVQQHQQQQQQQLQHQSATSTAPHQKRIDVRVHSSTSGSLTTFKRDDHGHCIEVTFPDVFGRAKDSVVVWDLSQVRCLTGSHIQVSLTESTEGSAGVTANVAAANGFSISSSSFVTTIETFISSPPFVGDRMSYPARDNRGIPFDIELYACSGAFSFDKKEGAIGVKSMFPTVAPRGVSMTSGKWYYEATLIRTGDGVAQIGFCDSLFSGDDKLATGAGDDEHSWAFDGNRVKKWSGQATSWGKKWKDGDVLGCAIDIEEKKVWFSLNGMWKKPMGVAFSEITVVGGVFPAVTAERAFKCKLNFGQTPLRFAPPKPAFKPVFDWILTHRDSMGDETKSQVWFREAFTERSNQVWTPNDVTQPVLARYLRVSFSARDREPIELDTSTGETLLPTISSLVKSRIRPRVQAKISVRLRGNSRPFWEVRASRLLSSSREKAVETLTEQRGSLVSEMMKSRNQLRKSEDDLRLVLDVFRSRLVTLTLECPSRDQVTSLSMGSSTGPRVPLWSIVETMAIVKKRVETSAGGAFLPHELDHPLAYEGLRVIECIERCWKARKAISAFRMRLEAVERELIYLGVPPFDHHNDDWRVSSAEDVRLQLARFITSFSYECLEKAKETPLVMSPFSVNDEGDQVGIQMVSELFRLLCIDGVTLDSKRGADLIRILLERSSPKARAHFYVSECSRLLLNSSSSGMALRDNDDLAWLPSMALAVNAGGIKALSCALGPDNIWLAMEPLLERSELLPAASSALAVVAKRKTSPFSAAGAEQDRSLELASRLLQLIPAVVINREGVVSTYVADKDFQIVHGILDCLVWFKELSDHPWLFVEGLLANESFIRLFTFSSCTSSGLSVFTQSLVSRLLSVTLEWDTGAGRDLGPTRDDFTETIKRVCMAIRGIATKALDSNAELCMQLFLKSFQGGGDEEEERSFVVLTANERSAVHAVLSMFDRTNDGLPRLVESRARAMALAMRLLYQEQRVEEDDQAEETEAKAVFSGLLNNSLQLVNGGVPASIIEEDLLALLRKRLRSSKKTTALSQVILEAFVQRHQDHRIHRNPLNGKMFMRILQILKEDGHVTADMDPILVKLLNEVALALPVSAESTTTGVSPSGFNALDESDVTLKQFVVSSCLNLLCDKQSLKGLGEDSCKRMVRWMAQSDPSGLTKDHIAQRRRLCGSLARLFMVAGEVPCPQFLSAIVNTITDDFNGADPASPSVQSMPMEIPVQLVRGMINKSRTMAFECASHILTSLHQTPPAFIFRGVVPLPNHPYFNTSNLAREFLTRVLPEECFVREWNSGDDVKQSVSCEQLGTSSSASSSSSSSVSLTPVRNCLFKSSGVGPLESIVLTLAGEVTQTVNKIWIDLGTWTPPALVRAECGLSSNSCVPLGVFTQIGTGSSSSMTTSNSSSGIKGVLGASTSVSSSNTTTSGTAAVAAAEEMIKSSSSGLTAATATTSAASSGSSQSFASSPTLKYSYLLHTTSYVPCNVIRIIVEFPRPPSSQSSSTLTATPGGNTGGAVGVAGSQMEDEVWFRRGDKVRLISSNIPSGDQQQQQTASALSSDAMKGVVIDFDGEVASVRWNNGRVDAVSKHEIRLKGTSKSSSSSSTMNKEQQQSSTSLSTPSPQPAAVVLQRVQVAGKDLDPVQVFEGSPMLVDLLDACCEDPHKEGREVAWRLLKEKASQVKELLQRMVAANVELPRKLVLSASKQSSIVAMELLELLLNNDQVSPEHIGIAAEMCCTWEPSTTIEEERKKDVDSHLVACARVLLEKCRDGILKRRPQWSLHLMRAYALILEELMVRRGLDLGVTVSDVELFLSRLRGTTTIVAVLEGSISEMVCVQAIHALARTNVADLRDALVQSIRSLDVQSANDAKGLRMLKWLATTSEESLTVALEILESVWSISDDDDEEGGVSTRRWRNAPLCFLNTLVHLADCSGRVRTWLRDKSWLSSLLKMCIQSEEPETSLEKGNQKMLEDEIALRREEAVLTLIVTAMNRNLENQLLVAQSIADALLDGVSSRFLTQLMQRTSRLEDRVSLVVWNLQWELDRLREALPEETGMFNPFHPRLSVLPSVPSSSATPASPSLVSLFNLQSLTGSTSSAPLLSTISLTSSASSTSSSAMTSSGATSSSIAAAVAAANAATVTTANRMMPFRLNPSACGKTIEIGANGLSATQVAAEKWGVVRGDRELPLSGISSWEVRLDSSPKGHIFVGVATSRSNVDGYLGCDRHGWGFIGNRGIWHNKHKENTYGKDFRTGDVVRVVVDATEGTLSFALNGEDLGVAFNGLVGLKLYPAFSLYQKGDRFTVLSSSFAKMDTDDPMLLGQGQNGAGLRGLISLDSLFLRSRQADEGGMGVFYTVGGKQGDESEEEVSGLDKLRFGDPGSRLRYLNVASVFTVRASAPARLVLYAIGKGAMLNQLRSKYKREELYRLDNRNEFEATVRNMDSGVEEEKEDLTENDNRTISEVLMRIKKGREDLVEVDLRL